jgi:hypothetical protein
LEEQKQKAYNRLSEFRIAHETACAQGTADLKEACSHFEREFNERLKELRKSVMGKLKLLSIEADQKLSILVDEGRGKVEQQTGPAISELEAAKNQADIEAAFTALRAAADDFASLYAEKLSQILDGDPTKTLEERAQKEVGRISYWRSGTLKDFQESGQRLSERIKSDRAVALTNIETVVNRMLDELQRMKELDQTSSTLLESQFNRAVSQSKEEAELHLKTLCEKAMATQVLPLLANLKVSIAKSSHEMRAKLAQLLEGESKSSLSDFDKLLATAKESMAETSGNVVDLKAAFETDGKSKVDELLSHLTSHLDKKLDEFRESFRILEETDPNETPESRLLKRAEHLRSTSLAALEANIDSLQHENKKQAEEIFHNWQTQADTTYEARTKAISEEIAQFKTKRRESLAKIEQLLQKHTDSAESIAAEFIQ